MKKILILTILILSISLQIISASNPQELNILFQEKVIRGQTSELIIRAKNETGIYQTSIQINKTKGISINSSNFDERNQLIVILNIGFETELGNNEIIITSTDERTLMESIILVVEDPKTKIEIIDEQEKMIKYIFWAISLVIGLIIFIIILTLVIVDLNKRNKNV